jgi:hypothetical protein
MLLMNQPSRIPPDKEIVHLTNPNLCHVGREIYAEEIYAEGVKSNSPGSRQEAAHPGYRGQTAVTPTG